MQTICILREFLLISRVTRVLNLRSSGNENPLSKENEHLSSYLMMV